MSGRKMEPINIHLLPDMFLPNLLTPWEMRRVTGKTMLTADGFDVLCGYIELPRLLTNRRPSWQRTNSCKRNGFSSSLHGPWRAVSIDM